MQWSELDARLERIEKMLVEMASSEPPKEYYSTAEIAELLNRSDWTVREWCRLGRIWAEKRQCGRGVSREWMISHEELLRVKNEGLLPV